MFESGIKSGRRKNERGMKENEKSNRFGANEITVMVLYEKFHGYLLQLTISRNAREKSLHGVVAPP